MYARYIYMHASDIYIYILGHYKFADHPQERRHNCNDLPNKVSVGDPLRWDDGDQDLLFPDSESRDKIHVMLNTSFLTDLMKRF